MKYYFLISILLLQIASFGQKRVVNYSIKDIQVEYDSSNHKFKTKLRSTEETNMLGFQVDSIVNHNKLYYVHGKINKAKLSDLKLYRAKKNSKQGAIYEQLEEILFRIDVDNRISFQYCAPRNKALTFLMISEPLLPSVFIVSF